MMNRFLVALFIGALVIISFGASCEKKKETSLNTAKISIEKGIFDPVNLTVSKGTVVTWQNNDSADHKIITDGNLAELESGVIGPNNDFVYTFNQTGTFTYHCQLHPDEKGTVTVK